MNLAVFKEFKDKIHVDNGYFVFVCLCACVQLGTDTWFYAKRCFLSLLENMSKHMVMLRDAVVKECVQFLEHCEGELQSHNDA